ncbi:MAG: polysaccharide deacetylase family protein [Bacteroidales bacterium]|nr:polysaccharide deacetylase family protein [Bacteroidales bacterium]
MKTPFIFRLFSRQHLICNIPSPENEIYLTFDDGPIPEATPAILEILKERDVKVTFFCVGHNVMKYPEVFELVRQGGHAIGNHTFHHLNGWKTAPASYYEDVTRCEEYFQTTLFRPPHGRFTPSQYYLLRNRYLFVMWSVLAKDYHRRVTPEKCLDIVINQTLPGSIVVFHDSVKAIEKVLYALPRFLDHFLEQGYSFKVLKGR